ncbi:MAG: sugar transferase [Candidatus Margulisbacteria bacterium]|nr:sugar transferase [Candidatus Margulisiibacteriota bacterium]
MKKELSYKQPLVLFKLIGDLLLIPISFILAYSFKFKIGWLLFHVFSYEGLSIYTHAQIEPYMNMMGIIMLIWVSVFYVIGMYDPFYGLMPEVDEWIRIVKGVTIGTIFIMALSFIHPAFPGSRYVLIYSWAINIVLISIHRYLIFRFEIHMIRRGKTTKKTVVIGSDDVGQDVAEKMILYPSLGLTYVGTLDTEIPENIHYHLQDRFNLFGEPKDYLSLFEKGKVDAVFITKKHLDPSFITQLIADCHQFKIELRVLSDLSSLPHLNYGIDLFDGLVFFNHRKPNLPKLSLFFKRIMDILISASLLILLSPVFLTLIIILKLTTKDSVFYTQERVTQYDRHFNMYKFRSMVSQSESKSGPMLMDDATDAQFTPLGQFLRKTSLDEIPQILNVLKGDMSIVGPRPERPYFVDKFEEIIPYYRNRHDLKSGITGWAQINGRSFLTKRPAHKVRYDLYYIHNWSLVLDIKILLKTILVVMTKQDAY